MSIYINHLSPYQIAHAKLQQFISCNQTWTNSMHQVSMASTIFIMALRIFFLLCYHQHSFLPFLYPFCTITSFPPSSHIPFQSPLFAYATIISFTKSYLQQKNSLLFPILWQQPKLVSFQISKPRCNRHFTSVTKTAYYL